jgi:hypothetical protein
VVRSFFAVVRQRVQRRVWLLNIRSERPGGDEDSREGDSEPRFRFAIEVLELSFVGVRMEILVMESLIDKLTASRKLASAMYAKKHITIKGLLRSL